MTKLTWRVLAAIHARPEPTYGGELREETGIQSGTLYPLLVRLEGAGLLTSRWEEPAEYEAFSRPRRRYYALTEAGRAAAGTKA
jgi:DNA-binding PadR family transcriptional regulator